MKDLKEGKYMDDDLLLRFFGDEGDFMKPETQMEWRETSHCRNF
jgi:hypothetical protein